VKKNPLISDGKRRSSSLMEIDENLSENFDASVKILASPPPQLTGSLKEDRALQYSELQSRDNLRTVI
jgi:hypothetical protein